MGRCMRMHKFVLIFDGHQPGTRAALSRGLELGLAPRYPTWREGFQTIAT